MNATTHHIVVVEVVAVVVEGVEDGLQSDEYEEWGEQHNYHQPTVAHCHLLPATVCPRAWNEGSHED